ncbi:uncharacterized protein LOC103712646 [Phoenix dactylifera]|uniref:Uncharacterized protein LOC103712646 n=1 Tax=Phoenix dactylifera TaxID=42345 RepID=A0A8B7CEM3_PHODC|nr:uncharacterized protein LOC103712646 [Phoenix dactylifera]
MKEEGKQKLTLEDYLYFLNNLDRHRLSLDQLNQIVFMHGFIRFRTKKEILANLNAYDLMRPTRSTIRERGTTSCAALELEEVKDDIAALGWQECPIGSLSTVRPRALAPVAEAAPEAVSISSASAASHLDRLAAASSGVKKRKRRNGRPRPVAALPAGELTTDSSGPT